MRQEVGEGFGKKAGGGRREAVGSKDGVVGELNDRGEEIGRSGFWEGRRLKACSRGLKEVGGGQGFGEVSLVQLERDDQGKAVNQGREGVVGELKGLGFWKVEVAGGLERWR
ncbi:hypothetical protein COCNU_scaffold006608G000010 [Cocos nucifera]|nr:hypothetical protein [Cocos nucifera]